MHQRQFFIFLLVVAALVSQVLAAQHIHAEDTSSACLVCVQADETSAVETNTCIAFHEKLFDQRVAVILTQFLPETQRSTQARAPPYL